MNKPEVHLIEFERIGNGYYNFTGVNIYIG